MDDFEEKLNSILASPEAMGQIMALANSISGQQAEQSPSEQESRAEREEPEAGNPFDLFRDLDPGMIPKLLSLYGEYTRSNDEKTALLQALRPFLREERQQKLDRAVQIARLSRVIRLAFQQFGGERDV